MAHFSDLMAHFSDLMAHFYFLDVMAHYGSFSRCDGSLFSFEG